jgi:hypothetical protein
MPRTHIGQEPADQFPLTFGRASRAFSRGMKCVFGQDSFPDC